MGETKRRNAPGTAVLEIIVPVSPLNARSVLVPSAPIVHTMLSPWPSVVVTIGAPRPPSVAHQPAVIAGGDAAVMWNATRSPDPVLQCPWNATIDPLAAG